MVKTTVYIETDLALELRHLASLQGRSQAEIIRAALSSYTRQQARPPIPGIGEFDSGKTGVSERAGSILRQAAKRGKWRKTSSRGAHS